MHALKPTTNLYKASFCSSDGRSTQLEGKRAVLLVSVGQAYHETDKLAATIARINQSDLALCDVMLADTLQHYNVLHQLSKEKALETSHQAGDAWIKRNTPLLEKLTIPCRILRWHALLEHQDFFSYYQLIKTAYENNLTFKRSIDMNVQQYMTRQVPSSDAEGTQFIQNSTAYLLEECPIIMPLAAQLGYERIIYPKPMSLAMQATYALFVQPHFRDKCQWFSLRFKKRHNIASVSVA